MLPMMILQNDADLDHYLRQQPEHIALMMYQVVFVPKTLCILRQTSQSKTQVYLLIGYQWNGIQSNTCFSMKKKIPSTRNRNQSLSSYFLLRRLCSCFDCSQILKQVHCRTFYRFQLQLTRNVLNCKTYNNKSHVAPILLLVIMVLFVVVVVVVVDQISRTIKKTMLGVEMK